LISVNASCHWTRNLGHGDLGNLGLLLQAGYLVNNYILKFTSYP